MRTIQNISDNPNQKMSITIDDGTFFTMELQYMPAQLGWFITKLTYGTFVINTMRISTNPNILYQYRNQIPFGLACFTKDNAEPTLQQDFLSGASTLHLLSQAECETLSEIYSGEI